MARPSLWIAGLLLMGAASAHAQINARVLVLVSSSGSNSIHLTDGNNSGGDGTGTYVDGVMTRTAPGSTPYVGFASPAPVCTGMPAYDGVNSRLYAQKAAFNYVLANTTQIDWGLLRFTQVLCPFSSTATLRNCASSATCASGTCSASHCTCTADGQCNNNEFCIGGVCGTDPNLCNLTVMGTSDTRGGTACGNHTDMPVTDTTDCGSAITVGKAPCNTLQTCTNDADCTGGGAGRCLPVGGGPVRVCSCPCPGPYRCNAQSQCEYNQGCEFGGGEVVVSPSPSATSQILPYIDNVEDFRDDGTGKPINPEMHPSGNTPLAGAIRAATNWYQSQAPNDPLAPCRQYALVLMTNGNHTCSGELDTVNGPIAAIQGFVAATLPGARFINKVYVVAVTTQVPNTPFDAMAKAGGTSIAFKSPTLMANEMMAIAGMLAPTTGVHLCGPTCLDDTDVAGCGTSCTPCPSPMNGVPTCDGVNCGIACANGFHDCGGACVDSHSIDSCGTSCTPCPTPALGMAGCDGTRCGQVCAGPADCPPSTDPCAVAVCLTGMCTTTPIASCVEPDLAGAEVGDLGGLDLAGLDLSAATAIDLAIADQAAGTGGDLRSGGGDLAPVPVGLFPKGYSPSRGCAFVPAGPAQPGWALLLLLLALRRRRAV